MLNSRTRLATSTLCACFHVVISLVLFMRIKTSFAVSPGHLDEQGFSGKTFLRFCTSFFCGLVEPICCQEILQNRFKLSRDQVLGEGATAFCYSGAEGRQSRLPPFPCISHAGSFAVVYKGLDVEACFFFFGNNLLVLENVVFDKCSISGAQFFGDVSFFRH